KQAPPEGGAQSWSLTVACYGLPTSDVGHIGRHNSHELHVGVQRQAGHVHHGLGNMFHIHEWLGAHRTVCLHHAPAHDVSHFTGGVADIDLSAGNVISPAVQ